MKKIYLFLCMTLLVSFVSAQSTDMSLFGFKGKVSEVRIGANSFNYGYSKYGSFLFDEYGYSYGIINLWSGIDNECYTIRIDDRTKNSLSGVSQIFGDFKATVTNNRVTKIVMKTENGYGPVTYTYTFSYDKKGNLIKGNEVFVYYDEEKIEYGGRVTGVDAYQAELNKLQAEFQKKLMNGMTPQQAQKWYDNAVQRLNNKANGIGVSGYARTKKTKKTLKAEYTYGDYEFDDFGNWTSRTYKKKGEEALTQYQTIKYDPDFWSQFYWERLEKEGDLHKIEAFYNHQITTETYKAVAAQYWNDRILNEVAQKYDNNLDSLCCVAGKKIASDIVKQQALDYVGNKMYNDEVLAEQDYSRVLQMKDTKRQNIAVYNDRFQKMITERGEQLKQDSIRALTNKAQQEFESAQYQKCLATCRHILKIDSQSETAINLGQESSYRMILSKEEDNSVKESDYADFIEEFTSSVHLQEMKNKRALYASSLFSEATPEEEMKRVLELPTDEPTHKTVKKRYDKCMFMKHRGKPFFVGGGVEVALGPVNTIGGVELAAKGGYIGGLFNVTVGLKYNYMTSTSHIFDSISGPGEGFFKRSNISAPIMVRYNYMRTYELSSYIGVGAELNFYTVSAKLRDVVDIKDNNFANNMYFTPRIAWGFQIAEGDMELFATYDLSNPYDVDYIKDYELEDGQNIYMSCDPSTYEKQINGNGFFDKLRFGVAIRIMF